MFKQKINTINLALTMRTRVGFMWFLTFFYQAGFILAWIVTTSLFIEFFGIQNLLFLFLFEAGLVFLGSLLSHFFLQKIEVTKILLFSAGIILFLIFAGFFLQEGESNQIEFLFLGIIAKDLLYPRLRIGIIRKTEELFSPLQAEKAVPIIDSALTIGLVVMAGIILLILEFFPGLNTQELLFVWILPLLLIGGMLLFEKKILKKIPHLYDKKDPYEHQGSSFRKIFNDLKQHPFLKYLVVVILLQSFLYTTTEFAFIRDLDANFEKSETIELFNSSQSLQANIFKNFANNIEKMTTDTVERVIQKTKSRVYAHETLLHDLTGLSLIFGIIALFVQFIVTPWALSKYGIVRAINGYFAGFLVFTFSFIWGGHLAINMVRGYEHSFHSLFMSGYHLSFYSVVEKNREFLRHIVEGMITPLGIILGVIVVYLLKMFFWLDFLPLVITVLAGLTLAISFLMQRSRTHLAQKNLSDAENISQKIRAIEVLGQKGQHNSHKLLSAELKNSRHPLILREKITETLTAHQKVEIVHTYIAILSDENEPENIKMRVLESMLKIEDLRNYAKKRHFMNYKMVEVLKKLFEKTKDSYLRKLLIMNIFKHLSASEVVPFFHRIMNSQDDILQSLCLRSCVVFEDPDLISFIVPYLEHRSARVRSHALIALWKLHETEEEYLREILDNLLESDDPEAKVAGIYAVGEIKDKKSLFKLRGLFREEDLEVRLHSLVARAKMNDHACVSGILELMFAADNEMAYKVFRMLKRGLPAKIREKLQEATYREVARRVHEIVGPYVKINNQNDKLSASVLDYLQRLYHFVGRHDDLLILKQRYRV